MMIKVLTKFRHSLFGTWDFQWRPLAWAVTSCLPMRVFFFFPTIRNTQWSYLSAVIHFSHLFHQNLLWEQPWTEPLSLILWGIATAPGALVYVFGLGFEVPHTSPALVKSTCNWWYALATLGLHFYFFFCKLINSFPAFFLPRMQ